jgi:glucose/arabinose dehydrogenase
VGFGVNYTTGAAIHSGTMRQGMEAPVNVWVPSIGISGMMFYTGDRFPEWKGSMFVGGLAGQKLVRLTLDGRRVTHVETFAQQFGRIRDVRMGPDGFVYLAIEARDGSKTPVVRLEPAN